MKMGRLLETHWLVRLTSDWPAERGGRARACGKGVHGQEWLEKRENMKSERKQAKERCLCGQVFDERWWLVDGA